jgi:hypothetical protein
MWAKKTKIISVSESKQVMSPDLLFDSSLDVLLDAFTVKDMPTLRLDGVLGNVIANAADGGFSDIFRVERLDVCFALEYEIGMTSHLPHSGETALQVSARSPDGE